MANEIDDLMDLDPLSLSARDIDAIIAYHRNARAVHEAGGPKPKRGAQPKVAVDLSAMVKGMTAPKTAPKTGEVPPEPTPTLRRI